MRRHVCIHGHFYQPPREHAWLETVELQESAYPYHDWNQRIAAECYAPNARSRILDEQGRIARIVNNYERISFDAGPTLMSWLERHDPRTYGLWIEADAAGLRPAMAQAYNHAILPLCNARDRRTQVLWGIADFRRRFGREPEGMWLPETAVDTDSLSLLAEQGIRYTVLAPGQAAAWRGAGESEWRAVAHEGIDPRRPYRVALPGDREIAVFFYDGPLSRGVAFEGLLGSGTRFARRLLSAFDDDPAEPQLVHIATDGESYGHHHPHGDMALAHALQLLEDSGSVELTSYAEFLERHPPRHEARIVENSSWSCAHGVGRWREDCGCGSEIRPGFDQAWRRPLREALDLLRDTLAPAWEREAREVLPDPWAARDGYVDAILDRSPASVRGFLERHGGGGLDGAGRARALGLLELQRHAQLMYTSCGWFFEEPSRLETVQILQYAGRAVHLAERWLPGLDLSGFPRALEAGASNLAEHGSLREIYERKVLPARVEPSRVAADRAAGLLFDEDEKSPSPFGAWDVETSELRREASRVAGRLRVTSRITLESEELPFDVEYAGREIRGSAGGREVRLDTLFRDRQRRVIDRMLQTTLDAAEEVYRGLYRDHAPLMKLLSGLGATPPAGLRAAAELVLDAELERELARTPPRRERLSELLAEARREGVRLDEAGLGHAARGAMERLARELAALPEDESRIAALLEACDWVDELPFAVDLWETRNLVYDLPRVAALRPLRKRLRIVP